METKYPNTLVSSREDKKLVYANNVYSKYYGKSIEDKVMDLDNENYTIKNNIKQLDNNIEQLTNNINNNTNDITKIKKDISTNKTNIELNKTNIATNKANISTNTSDISKLKTANTGINNDIKTIKADINTNKNNINTNKEDINYIKGTIEHITDTMSTQYYTNTEVDNKLGNIIENTWCTKELINCTGNDDSHKLYVGRIDIPKNISNINYFTTITIRLAKDATSSNSLKIRILDSEDNFIADSNNYIIQSDNTNKYVTWYFDPITVPQNGVHVRFIDLNNKYDFLRVHGSMDNVGITCLGMDLQVYTMCPAIGFNVTPLVHLDLYNKLLKKL